MARDRAWPDIAIPPGEVLAETLEARAMSQAELARKSGVHQSVISRIESGSTQSVTFRNLEKLAAALGCDPGYLVAGRERARQGGWKRRRTGRLV